jgi:tetratricopeptide (TPR) repeat protein
LNHPAFPEHLPFIATNQAAGSMRIRAIDLGVLMIAVVIGLATPLAVSAAGSGVSGGQSMGTPREMTPEERAKSAYNQGVRAVKQADKSGQDAATATNDKKKAKAAERAQKQYAKAREYFAAAAQLKPGMYEAWNYIGYTSRKLGEYDNALAAYGEALQLNPSYAEAIEYRGEAYLGLNRIEDAKGAYMTLFASARPLADQLLAAMQQWIVERRGNATAIPAADVDTFSQWIEERTNIAHQTASLAIGSAQARWTQL